MSADELAAASGLSAIKMSFAAANVAEQWRLFKRQLTYYFDSKYTAGQLTNRRKVGLLMTALGREGVEIFDTLFAAEEQPLYEEIVQKFGAYCNPQKNTVFEHSVYFRLVQKPDQPVDMFLLSLKKQAALCEFDSAEKDELLRDILVIGIRDAKLREELLRDPELNLLKAVEACRARERSQNEALQMASFETSLLPVDQLKRRFPPNRIAKPCPQCSYLHGTSRPCPAVKAACKKCGQVGHFIKVCPSKSEKKAVQSVTEHRPPEGEPHHIDLLKIYQCTSQSPSEEGNDDEDAWYTDLRIGRSSCTFKLDTAAHCNTLALNSYNTLVPKPPLLRAAGLIKPYNAPPFCALGRVLVNYQARVLEFLVMPNGVENLLGFKACKSLGLVKRVSLLISYVCHNDFVEANSDLFKGVGKIPGQNKIYVHEAVRPSVAHWRRFAYSLIPKLTEMLKEMQRQEIIAPVTEPTDWVSNITIVEKTDGTLRICLDPQNLNKAIKVPKFAIPKADDILVQLNKKTLFTVIDLKSDSWPTPDKLQSPDRLQLHSLRTSLSVSEGLLFYENCLVIPCALCSAFVAKLHEGHLGIEKAKRLAREMVYWPGLAADIAAYVNSCLVCQKFARNNPRQPLQPYPIPRYPWQHLALDIATFNGRDYLVVVDKFSNWPEVVTLTSKTAAEIVSHLKCLFARHGIPELIVSDNNPFNSSTYLTFAVEWGFQATFTCPHYAQANGNAEQTVQTIKMLLRKSHEDKTSFQYALLQYRNTPIADTGFSPAQVLVGPQLRTKLPVASKLLIPATVPQDAIVANKEKSQAVQKFYYDQSARELPPLGPSQKVWVKDDQAEHQWQPATVRTVGPSPRSFTVEKVGGGTVVRNRQFLRPRNTLVKPQRFWDATSP